MLLITTYLEILQVYAISKLLHYSRTALELLNLVSAVLQLGSFRVKERGKLGNLKTLAIFHVGASDYSDWVGNDIGQG